MFILNDIRARGVETESLQLGLLDHVCCIIEAELEENGDFGLFYLSAITRFYKNNLAEIEEETQLLLTFKNYYAMKKITIFSGVVSAAAFIIGSVLKVFHQPGAGLLLFIGLLSISFLFLPMLLILKLKEVKEARDKFILLLGTITGMLYFLAVLFKIMHWPGANMLGACTFIITIFLFIPLYFFTGIRNPETKLNTIISTVLLLAVTGSQFTLVNLRPSQKQATENTQTVTPNESNVK